MNPRGAVVMRRMTGSFVARTLLPLENELRDAVDRAGATGWIRERGGNPRIGLGFGRVNSSSRKRPRKGRRGISVPQRAFAGTPANEERRR